MKNFKSTIFSNKKESPEFNKRPACRQAGMTYVELIVVLGIFSIMSSVVVFDYGKFQARVNLKNLANDIATRIVEAQKDALAGQWTDEASDNWTPAYGVFFDLAEDDGSFFYFADLNNDQAYENVTCSGECLDSVNITQGNFVSAISVTGQGSCSSINSLTVVFTRPDSSARMITNQPACTQISYAEITISSPTLVTAQIKIYSSGRIQIN